MSKKRHPPRRGSIAFRPRKRAERLVPRIRAWRKEGKGLMGFAGYKVGMTHVLVIDDRESPTKGHEIVRPVTVVEVPPVFVYSIVALEKTPYGLKVFTEVPCANAPRELRKVFTAAKKPRKMVTDLENNLSRIAECRVKACSQPKKSGLNKRTPEFFEIGLGGNPAEQLEVAKSLLGKEVSVSDVLSEGEFVDVIAVTKGKGWQGVVKRFGVALNIHKATKARRHGGALGPEKQGKVMYTVPRAGQTGFHRRTEVGKRVVKLGNKAEEVTPRGGFIDYGVTKSDFLLLTGSIPGPAKRFMILRKSLEKKELKPIELRWISLDSKK
ncbi:50S ribosomal protein L3 [Candidatus Micrarchaeota archaeon]|nr:50S ribosomal protein L3 [Candidatus Micrarchaeota archaeon]